MYTYIKYYNHNEGMTIFTYSFTQNQLTIERLADLHVRVTITTNIVVIKLIKHLCCL